MEITTPMKGEFKVLKIKYIPEHLSVLTEWCNGENQSKPFIPLSLLAVKK